MMPTYLLDTNHLGQVATKGSDVRRKVADRRASGDRFATCGPVLCELEVGIQQTPDPAGYRRTLQSLMRSIRLWAIESATARIYGELWNDLRLRGRKLSQVDLMLAALAIQRDATVLTTDRDFEALPQVKVENWLK